MSKVIPIFKSPECSMGLYSASCLCLSLINLKAVHVYQVVISFQIIWCFQLSLLIVDILKWREEVRIRPFRAKCCKFQNQSVPWTNWHKWAMHKDSLLTVYNHHHRSCTLFAVSIEAPLPGDCFIDLDHIHGSKCIWIAKCCYYDQDPPFKERTQ